MSRLRKRRGGFTLVELVVVMTILALLTTVAVQSLSSVQDQAHFDATQRTLTEIRGSILGPDAITREGELASGGYLQDVGWLPAAPTDLMIPPVISSSPALAMPPRNYSLTWRTYFGWSGPYITQPLRATGSVQLYDGYGRDFYGWFGGTPWTTPVYADFALRSTGADGIMAPAFPTPDDDPNVFNRDFPVREQPLIPLNMWSVDLRNLSISFKNLTGVDLPADTISVLRLRVVVPRWDQATAANPELALQYRFTGSSTDRDGWQHYGAKTFSLPAIANNASSSPIQFGETGLAAPNDFRERRVPLGRRMLYVVKESDGTPFSVSTTALCTELHLSSKLTPKPIIIEIR